MADEVEIVNFGEGGVASEATLASLTRAIEKLAASTGRDPKTEAGKLQELHNKHTKSSVDLIDEFNDEKKEETKATKEATKSLNTFSNRLVGGLIGAITGTLGSIKNLTGELLTGGDRLSDFTQHLPIVGNFLSGLTGHLDDSFETFRSLSSSGASFNNNMQDMMRAAAGARMSLSDFGTFVINNSQELARFGGTVTQGALQIARMQKGLGSMREDLLGMGFTFEEINEGLVNYQMLNRAGSRAQQQDQQALALAAGEYLKHLGELSKLTGRSVDELQSELQQRQMNAAFQMKLAQMDPVQRRRIQENLAIALAEGGQAGADRFMQMVLGMAPLTEETATLAATMPLFERTLRNMVDSAMNTTLTNEQFQREQEQNRVAIVRSALETAENFDSLISAAAAGIDGPASTLLGILNGMGIDFTKYANLQGAALEEAILNDMRAAQIEQNRQGRLTNAMAAFNNRITEARRTIQESFINSGIYDQAADAVAYFAEVMGSPQVINAIKTGIDILREFIDKFRQDPMVALGDAIRNIGDAIGDYLFGTTQEENLREQQEDLNRVDNRIGELQQQLREEASRTASMSEIDREAILSPIREELERTRQRRENIVSRDTSATEGLVAEVLPDIKTGILGLFTSEAAGVALAGAIVGLFALNAAKNALVSGISGLLGSVGRGAGSLGTGVGRGAAGLGRGAGVGLRGLAMGLSALANPFALVGLGAVTLAIMGIGKAVQYAAPGIEAFGSALRNVLEGLAPVVEAFAPVIESLGSAISNTFEGLASIIESFAGPIRAAFEGVSGIIESAATPITAVFDGLKNVADGVGGAISSVVTSMGTSIQNSLSGVASVIESAARPISAVFDGLTSVADGVGGAISSVVTSMGDGIKNALEGVASVLESAAAPITAVFDGLRNVTEGIGNAISAPITAAGTAVQSALNGVASVIESSSGPISAAGTAVQSALNGVASVVESSAAPITAAFNGISTVVQGFGTALSAPIESAGVAIETALNGVSSVVDSIGNTITGSIRAVGDSIANVITSINEYKTAGIEATTNQITTLADIPGENLVTAARGLELMKAALEGFTPGFFESFGSFLLGGQSAQDQQAQLSFITGLAQAFESFNIPNITSASNALTAMGSALSALGAGMDAQPNTGGLLGNIRTFFTGTAELPFDAIRSFEQQNFDIAKIRENADIIRQFGEIMQNMPSVPEGERSGGFFGAVGDFFAGAEDPLAPYALFGEYLLNGTAILANIQTIKDYSAKLNEIPAINTQQIIQTTNSLVNFSKADWNDLVTFGNNITLPTDSLIANATTVKDFASKINDIPAITTDVDSLIDKVNLFTKTGGLGNNFDWSAIATFGGRSFTGVVENAQIIRDLSLAIAEIPNIDATRLEQSSLSFVSLTQGIIALRDSGISNLTLQNEFVDRLERLGSLGPGLSHTAESLATLANIEGLSEKFETLKEGLDTDGIVSYNDAIQNLIETIEELRDRIEEVNELQTDNNTVMSTIQVGNRTQQESFARLATQLQSLIEEMKVSNEYNKEISRNTKAITGHNVGTGYVSRVP